jgi:very-short-patch-repair endonuclease
MLGVVRYPFTLDEARAAGISFEALRGKRWRRIARGIYCPAARRVETWPLLHAWHRYLPGVVFIGFSAAWLHGLDVDASHPIEVAAATKSGTRSRPGLVVRHIVLAKEDVVTARDLPATKIDRTMRDLRRRLSRVEYLVLADAALKLGLGRFDELAEPAESPMETRLRWLLIDAGLPRPEVQTTLSFGRADLYYPSVRLVIEYDGVNHRDRVVEDNRRQNLLQAAGFRLLRFTAADLLQRPATIVSLVRDAVSDRHLD